jgi:hypothetical protein
MKAGALAAGLACVALAAVAAGQAPRQRSLDLWLSEAQTESAPAAPVSVPASRDAEHVERDDALPGVIELSDGKVLLGRLYSTRERILEVYDEGVKLWRRVPLEAVLGISAVVEEEAMDLEWRWKAMGEPERTYTGRSFPTRRLSWKLRLIDGTELRGAVKGAPLWLDVDGRQTGPYVLSERTKGEMGQKLADLVYVKRVIVSRRLVTELTAARVRQRQ